MHNASGRNSTEMPVIRVKRKIESKFVRPWYPIQLMKTSDMLHKARQSNSVLCADVRLSKQPQQVRVKFKIDFLYSYVSHLILVKMSWDT